MKVVFRDPKELIPYANNSKNHPQFQIEAIAKSIAEFGFDQPIVVDKNDVIIKGHGRTLASLFLKLPLVPVYVREDISDNDAKFLREVDNQIPSDTWDTENLASELNTLKDMGKLEFTLYVESDIPKLPELVLTSKVTEMDLTTHHVCNKCDYRW